MSQVKSSRRQAELLYNDADGNPVVVDPDHPVPVILSADAGINIGSVVVTACALPTGASTAALQTTGNTSLSSIDGKLTACNTGAVTISAALPAGSAVIGKVSIDQTTPGTTNAVQLTAGTAVVGKVSIDQTTPGTTNLVDTELPAAAALADTTSNPTVPMVGDCLHLYNGTTWDRMRSGVAATGLASATRTSSTATSAITNYNAKSLLVFLNVTSASGTGGLTLTVDAQDPISSSYAKMNANPTAVTATGLYVYAIGLGAVTAAGGITQATPICLPRTFRITVTAGDGSSYTYSAGYSLQF